MHVKKYDPKSWLYKSPAVSAWNVEELCIDVMVRDGGEMVVDDGDEGVWGLWLVGEGVSYRLRMKR